MKIVICILAVLCVSTIAFVCKVSDSYKEWLNGDFDDWQDY